MPAAFSSQGLGRGVKGARLMASSLSRRSFLGGAATLVGVCALGGLSACAGSGSGSGAAGGMVKIGSMPTEDILPFWVAERDGLFAKHGVEAEIALFDSAQSLSAAITAGEVALAMTDPMRTVKLVESGADLTMEWISLGTDASQGRFGVLAKADARFSTLREMTTVGSSRGVGLAANTVPEYVFDKLCEQEGFDAAAIPVEEVPSLPDRYSLVASGQLAAAALPGSMLALGEANGMKVIADDTKGDNISQSVIVAVRGKVGSGQLEALRGAWDEAADAINAAPGEFRALLAEKANLNDTIKDSYPISTYPHASADSGASAYPPASLIDPQIAWMKKKGYGGEGIAYNEADGSFVAS